MSLDDEFLDRPILVQKKKIAAEGGHGSAWKVAYADFVTAMMAFFLLLWLLNATTEDQKQGISNYFEPVGATRGTTGSGGVFGGISATDPGPIEAPGQTTSRQITMEMADPTPDEKPKEGDSAEDPRSAKRLEDMSRTGDDAAALEAAKDELQLAALQVPELRELANALVVEMTPRGLRIQLIDAKDTKVFDDGGARLSSAGRRLMESVSAILQKLPNDVEIAGHTTSAEAPSPELWPLSLQRANAARRMLAGLSIRDARMTQVIGKADGDPINPENPAASENRRVAILVMRQPTEEEKQEEAPPSLFRN